MKLKLNHVLKHMRTMVSQITTIQLVVQQLVETDIKENIKDQQYWLFVRGLHQRPGIPLITGK